MKTITKGDIINKIFAVTNADPAKYFDRLSDKSTTYLTKLLQVVKLL